MPGPMSPETDHEGTIDDLAPSAPPVEKWDTLEFHDVSFMDSRVSSFLTETPANVILHQDTAVIVHPASIIQQKLSGIATSSFPHPLFMQWAWNWTSEGAMKDKALLASDEMKLWHHQMDHEQAILRMAGVQNTGSGQTAQQGQPKPSSRAPDGHLTEAAQSDNEILNTALQSIAELESKANEFQSSIKNQIAQQNHGKKQQTGRIKKTEMVNEALQDQIRDLERRLADVKEESDTSISHNASVLRFLLTLFALCMVVEEDDLQKVRFKIITEHYQSAAERSKTIGTSMYFDDRQVKSLLSELSVNEHWDVAIRDQLVDFVQGLRLSKN